MDVPRDINYVALPSTSSEVVTATAAAAASSRRRKILVIGSATSVLLVLALLGAALYLSPPMQKKGDNNAGGGENIFLSRDNARLEPAAVSRGPSEGVSEKMSAVRYGDGGDDANGGGGFPWSNSMLQWQRTGFHFQPEKNWMNDPNGPVYYKGWYHLFYQYNPDAAVWGNITWGHAVSHDLVHWYHLPLAMVRDQWYDYNGVWTGSATVSSSGQVYMLYTGSTNASVQVQNLAFPADPSDALLINWTKYEGNPVLTPPSNLLPTDFRDPTTAWFDNSDGTWRIAIGSKDDSHAGITLVYKTKDFISYELVPGILHKVANTGMWECVDFFAVAASSSSANQAIDTTVLAAMGNGQDDIRHVLKASMDDDRHDYYAIGRYDAINNKWKPDNAEIDVGIGLRYDWGIFYAAKTFFDPVKQRRILWGWIGETDSERSDVRKGWASLMSIPRTVLFDIKTKSNLLQWPVEEVEKLRMNSTTFTDVTIDTASYYRLSATRAAQLDIVAEFEIKNTTLEKAVESDEEYSCTTSRGAADRGLLGPFGFLVLADKSLSEQTAVYFYVSRNSDGSLKTHFCQDETRSSKATDIIKKVVGNVVPVLSGETLTVRILVDHSIVEGFAQGGRTCITSRVYPTKAIDDAAGVYLFNNATAGPITAKSVTIWEMSSSYNRAYNGNDGDA